MPRKIFPVILLLAPRKVTAITVPVSGPDGVTVTASGRTSTVAWPSGVAGSASGSTQPRTLTEPLVTVPASLLVRPPESTIAQILATCAGVTGKFQTLRLAT